jgi:5-hydroxyisourate hydrolase-like protein (transthyretin family)
MNACAVQADPLGGPKDEIPPLPDSLKSTPNNQVFFEKQPIELVFNEWVTLKNENQIIVSPPLEHGLDIKLKKKTLVLDFDDEEKLLENTTYTINLGESIVDYTVGNSLDNYTYVFSTGAYLDSLSVSGKVNDDFTGEPAENVIVSLYADLQDSAVYKSRPLYFTRTDEDGRFRINNIRKDSFNLFALDDKNLNYFKDQESEKIGFYKETIALDSMQKSIKLGLFLPEPNLRVLSKIQTKGELKLTLNKAIDSLDYSIDGGIKDIDVLIIKDSVYLWHSSPEEREMIIDPKGAADTLILKSINDSLIVEKKNGFKITNVTKATPLSPFDSLTLKFNAPITTFDGSLFSIIDTSKLAIKTTVFQDKKDPRILKVKAKWAEGQKHKLEILPNAIETSLGLKTDTLTRNFSVNQEKSLGEIVFELDSLNKNIWYIVEIIQGDKKIVNLIKNEESKILTYAGLKPGKYEARITEDINKNGRWDAGDFFLRKPSERWIKKELESLKPNWTLEINMNGDEFK